MARNTARTTAEPEPLDRVVRWVRARDRTAAEVQQRLEALGVPAASIAQTLTRARALGYLDDARVLAARVAQLTARHASPLAVETALVSAGFEAQAIAAAVRQLDAVELAQAALASRRISGVRAARWLASRGFDESVIERVVPGLSMLE